MKSTFTTGEAAELCHLSQQTIIRCFDSGRLKGYKIPGSRFRRIPKEALIAFMKENSIPSNVLQDDKIRILVIDPTKTFSEDIQRGLENNNMFEVISERNIFAGGMKAIEFVPELIIVNAELKGVDYKHMFSVIRQSPLLYETQIALATSAVDNKTLKALRALGADTVIHISEEGSNHSSILQAIELALKLDSVTQSPRS
jgi:excisionase family DNA binding protein